ANVWYENYQGGPRLKSEDLCETCVQMQCKKLRALAQLDDDSKQLSELVKKCDSECAPYLKVGQDIPNSVLATKVWISKESLRNWKKIAKRAIDGPSQVALDKADQNKENEVQQVSSEEGNGDIGSFNADLFCEHGNMSPDPSTRRLIPKEAWAIIEKYFSNSVMLVATDSMSCDDCRNLEQQNTIEVQRSKEIAAKQRSALGDLYCNRNRPDIDKVGELYIVSTNFVQEWKRFIKDPSRHRPVVNINNRTLICEHEKFMYPMMFVSEFLKCNEEADEMVLLITPEEWLFMEENFECDQEIKVNVLNLDKKDNLEYRPDICNTCAESWLEGAFRRQFQYQDAPIYVIRREKGETFESEDEDAPKTTNIVSGKREVKPVNPDAWMQGFAGSNSVRRSQRPRNAKGEKTYKVSATTTIKELKSKICTDFKTLLSDQHLYYGSNELDNLSKKLQDYDIPAGAKLYLEIDTAENGSMDEPMSTVETGFQGTLLQGGSAFGDTRSPSS
ncbi:Ubiquitin carboxyl-terminal hydrolase 48, partial [Orchesella cincta]